MTGTIYRRVWLCVWVQHFLNSLKLLLRWTWRPQPLADAGNPIRSPPFCGCESPMFIMAMVGGYEALLPNVNAWILWLQHWLCTYLTFTTGFLPCDPRVLEGTHVLCYMSICCSKRHILLNRLKSKHSLWTIVSWRFFVNLLEQAEKKEAPSRKYLHQFGVWTSLWGLFICNDWY